MKSSLRKNAHGEPYLVYDVEDMNEVLSSEEFWSKLPVLPLQSPPTNIWKVPLFRSFFWGLTEMEEKHVTFQVANDTVKRDMDTPVVSNALGKPVQERLVMDDTMPFRPFMTGHDKETLTYSSHYYPRRMHDYVLQDYLPAFVLTEDQRFWHRAEELLAFLRFTRWKDDGTNDFVEQFYPEASSPRPDWAGGWDYVFDWAWLDGYGYQWSLHEPDHHVCSAIASLHINMYERTGTQHYLEDARTFVMKQMPRYGFHKGVWNGRVYYWTEYNPTGESVGNPVVDATDNVVALVAMAVAKIGYYESDPLTKGRLLEYARGLVWYLIREWETDGRWFYDGAENPMNERKYKSHDIVCIVCAMIALVYLYKAGADIAPFVRSLSDMEAKYAAMSGVFQRKAYLKMAKVYDGEPAPGNPLMFSTFFHVSGPSLHKVQFKDNLAAGISVPDTVAIRVSRLLPPDVHTSDWRSNPDADRTLLITSKQLKEGIELPFELQTGETYRICYWAHCEQNFNRSEAENPDSELACWLDVKGEFYCVRSTTGSYGDRLHSYTLPLSLQSPMTSANFLSFGARLLFPFSEEVEAQVLDSPWPEPEAYVQQEMNPIESQVYVYEVQSLFPWHTGGLSFEPEQHIGKGRVCKAFELGQHVEMEFQWPNDTCKVELFVDYTMGRDRGIVHAYVDGASFGDPINQFCDTDDSIPVKRISLGQTLLAKGKHTLSFQVVDKDPASSGYYIGLYHAIRIERAAESMIE
ncbi:hypothetical protein [Paenibacillus qinlingensis]|uniref:Uncharacterized protein n=1 Tax=Paenibacillus qinlingensis TaxID=1837343 RepID=A0ABU1NNU5_9BACL|nr:hypothetical protein [Paenibacillus qinlingensis]MDR6549134.1 hypothetical protein [Paenibacillus qinlingensis]